MKSVSIVLLSQHESLLGPCLDAIRKHTKTPCELIVVNDGGSPAIDRQLKRRKASVDRIVATERISGVAAGFNLGAAQASGDIIVMLRDHVEVTAGWLESLLRCLDEHPKAAMVGPVTNGVSGAQHILVSVDALLKLKPTERRSLLARHGASAPAPRLLSFLLAVRADVFRELGGFDERFALESYEDDDLCYRMMQAGYELRIARDSLVRYGQPPLLFPTDPTWYGRQLVINREAARSKWGKDITELLYAWERPASVSLCMIVKNEEETLERCLSSVADLVAEIVIVDTGSTDRTKEIAARFTDRIVDFQWVDDFSRARNFAFSLATQDYLMWLDADDVLLPADREKLALLLAAMPAGTDVVSMHYHLAKDKYGNVTSSLRRNRIVRRSLGLTWVGSVHEYLQISGVVLNSEIAITHDRVHTASSRNLNIYENKVNAGETFGPRDVYYYANELYDHQLWQRAVEQYEKLLAFGNHEVWIEDRIGACGRAAECYLQLGEMEKARQRALQSFATALPRAENCCRIGYAYFSEERYHEAIWWYRLATQLEMPADTSALLIHACWTWLPQLQLCVCYDRIGAFELAREANERAAAYLPDDSRVLQNRMYFAAKLGHTGG
ncbi:glycosyltransferase family 2 protein [Paenibacillus cymbidii]|uniref:glycosyltransferase family 2 protein n=1 Tax=Paenibacillus cymbidii TaxID=1639034 RepID=UPI0010811FC9|nr:glycosyltransferase [Paenibacillus cymbidii]